MRRISSIYTFYMKRIVPAIWAGALLYVVVVSSLRGPPGEWLLAIIVAVIMIPFGYFIMRQMGMFELADAVFDVGDSLIIRNGTQETRVSLSEITDISTGAQLMEPHWRAILSLRTPSIFGARVSFMLPIRILPFWPSPLVKELTDRVAASRHLQM